MEKDIRISAFFNLPFGIIKVIAYDLLLVNSKWAKTYSSKLMGAP